MQTIAIMEKEELIMDKKIDKVVVVKALGMLMTIGGMIAANWSGKKEQDETLAKLVNEKLKNE